MNIIIMELMSIDQEQEHENEQENDAAKQQSRV